MNIIVLIMQSSNLVVIAVPFRLAISFDIIMDVVASVPETGFHASVAATRRSKIQY